MDHETIFKKLVKELEVMENHLSIQGQRYGGIENMPQYDEAIIYRELLIKKLGD